LQLRRSAIIHFVNKKTPEIGIYDILGSVLLPENIDTYIKKIQLGKSGKLIKPMYLYNHVKPM